MSLNIVWYTGAPGSKWSSAANVLTSIDSLNFDISDRSSNDSYIHSLDNKLSNGVEHTGAYFGPGNQYGSNFDIIHKFDRSEIESEISKAWPYQPSRNILVKSHNITNNLNYIADTWTDSAIVMIIRPAIKCYNNWKAAGGWNISYPDYKTHYIDDSIMQKKISEHNNDILKFCKDRKIRIYKFNSSFVNEVLSYEKSKDDWFKKHLNHILFTNDVEIAIWNFEKLYLK
jgi:hypothetical protein